MQHHDACGRGKGCKAWTPTACEGSSCSQGGHPSAAAASHLGGFAT